MKRFHGLGVLLILAASGCAVSAEDLDDMDLEAIEEAEGAISTEEPGAPAGGAAGAPVSARRGPECAPIARRGESCGGFTRGPAPICAEGLYCQYRPGDVCGFADASGICARKPALCTDEHAPVCGCDGETYANACVASMNGVTVRRKGACARSFLD
jgi:hypothetical protein